MSARCTCRRIRYPQPKIPPAATITTRPVNSAPPDPSTAGGAPRAHRRTGGLAGVVRAPVRVISDVDLLVDEADRGTVSTPSASLATLHPSQRRRRQLQCGGDQRLDRALSPGRNAGVGVLAGADLPTPAWMMPTVSVGAGRVQAAGPGQRPRACVTPGRDPPSVAPVSASA